MKLRLLAAALVVTISPGLAAGDDWIAVVAPALQEAVTPLVTQRKAEGWEVTVIVAEENPAAAMAKIAELAADGAPCCVLLAGDFFPSAGGSHVSPGTGERLRMKGKPTDLPWASGAKNGNIEVGRLPARNSGEMAVMVKKILTWPSGQEPFPKVQLIAGHHGAAPALEGMANGVMNSLALDLVRQLPPAWRFEGAVHLDGSPWQIATADLPAVSRKMMTTHATFLAFMGHSAPNGAFSKDTLLLSDRDWRALPADGPRPGIFFTCGCHSCELTPRFEAFGFAAIRAAGGPPAVIGSHGETWAAMGYLAASGLIDRLGKNPPPVRLGTLWLAVQQGIAKGKIRPVTFSMLDNVDGTHGKVPLDQQRLEHLESWMLLGDPAMTLLPPSPAIQINAPPAAAAGQPLAISGTLPAELAGVAIRVTLERHPGIQKKPDSKIEMVTSEATATGTTFTATLDLPSPLPAKPWTIRVETTKPPLAGGVLQIK